MTVAIGVDVGTTGARAVAVAEDGRILADATSPYPLLTPRPRWVEQEPEGWWRGVVEVLRAVSRHLAETRVRAAAIGLTGQMHGSVFLDKAGNVIRPALLWNDQRTAKQCERISEAIGPKRLVEITGNPALTGFQAPKVLWLRDEEPDAFGGLATVLLPKDYIRYWLTGDFATDASDAAGTLFLDLRARDWSHEILEALEIPGEWLPPVHESSETTGTVSTAVAGDLDLPPGIPVAAGGGDNAAAAIGSAIIRDGLMSSSIGTSGVLFAHAERASIDPSGRIHAFCHSVPGTYCLLAVTLSAGGSLRWWREVTGVGYEELVAEAATVPPGAEGLLFLPYLMGERTPHLDPEARGAFVGLTARHTRSHMTRAVMEGVVFALRDGLEIMRELGLDPSEIRATGGAVVAPLWLQLQADVYGVPVHRLAIEEGAAYGAALLGHIAAGTFATVDDATSVVRTGAATEPDQRRVEMYDHAFAAYRRLYPSLREELHGLATFADPPVTTDRGS